MLTKHEQQVNDRKAFVTSAVIHALLLLLFLWLVVWRQPDPPTPGMPGIELNFGLNATGSGDNNSMDPASDPATTAETTPQEPTPVETPSDPTTPVNSTMPSEHVVKQTNTNTQTTQTTQTTQQTTQQTQQKPNPNSMMKPNPGDGVTGTTGNQGSKDGTTNSQDYYGNNGAGNGGTGAGGTGDGLSLSGWRWKKKPPLPNTSDEAGSIVFKIKVDDDGKIMSVQLENTSVSLVLVEQYKKLLWTAEFEPNGSNVAPSSSGSVTFNIKKTY